MRLIIAGNSSTGLESCEQHIRKIWKLLQLISNITESERQKVDNREDDDKERMTPPRPESLLSNQERHIISHLKICTLRFSFKKLVARFSKRYKRFVELRRRYLLAHNLGLPKDVMIIFENIIASIVKIAVLLGQSIEADKEGKQIDDSLFIDIIKWIKHLSDSYQMLGQNENLRVEEVGKFLSSPDLNEGEFPLHRYISKLVSLHTSAEALINWAQSPRLHRAGKIVPKVPNFDSRMADEAVNHYSTAMVPVHSDMLTVEPVILDKAGTDGALSNKTKYPIITNA
ncbi:hypothetical protein BDZ91DRAFT_795566 [Kalaharituber pfeilii]|nr:hypothetical protein BDZ91DRAFT_795566 [Kalaharituber pfeilii]